MRTVFPYPPWLPWRLILALGLAFGLAATVGLCTLIREHRQAQADVLRLEHELSRVRGRMQRCEFMLHTALDEAEAAEAER